MVLTDAWVSFFGIRRGRVDVSKFSPPLGGKQEEKSCGKRKTLLFFFVEIWKKRKRVFRNSFPPQFVYFV